ncbi:MAG: T9SS type A sorting domain-containing protein, partial [Owenweeksia sp.]
ATNSGLMVSDDGGSSWQDAFTAFTSNARDLFVTVSGKVWVKQGSGVYRSDNGNPGSFSLAPNLPSIAGRARIAASPEDDNYVYVIACTPGGTIGGQFDKAYQSKDGGDTWNIIGQRSSLLDPHAAQGNPQGGYNNLLGVSPIDKERIFVGGVTLWEWSAANGWLQIASLSDAPGNNFYVHADNHEIVFDPKNPSKIFVGNDGGIFKSTDNGFTWSWEVRNYITTQFYNIAVGKDGEMLGGTQDNGTIKVNPSSQFPKAGVRTPGINLNGIIRDGDGGYAEISRLDPAILFKEMQYGLMGRSVDGGESFNYVLDSKVDPRKRVGNQDFAPFVTPFTLWEKRFDPLSEDSIRFVADSVFLSIGFGNGNVTYTGTINPKQSAAQLVPEGLVIKAGFLKVTSNASGNLTGDGTGTYNTATGVFTVTFKQPVSLEITAKAAVTYAAGASITVESAINDLPVPHTLSNKLDPGESVMIQDPAQAMLFVGVTAYPGDPSAIDKNEFGGIWMTRQPLSNLGATPKWFHISKLSPSPSGLNPQTMKVSSDGNTLWMGTNSGRLYRITNIAAARDSADISVNDLYLGGVLERPATSVIQTSLAETFGGRAITAIAVHPLDPNKVAVTVGSYGNSSYVYVSTDALTGANFQSVQGDLPQMPAYSVTFNFNSINQLIVGTEAGVYATDDVFATNPSWSLESAGMDAVPVFDLIQDKAVRVDIKTNQDFEGNIYAGTHGRGIFRTTSTASYIGVDEPKEIEAAAREILEVFPNPASDKVRISLDLEDRTDLSITVRDINGKLVKTQSYKKLDRETREIGLDVSRLAIGTYILTVQEGAKVRTGKLVIAR